MDSQQIAPRIVVIGGGSGSSVLLRGLKSSTADLTAIVTMFDSGGSTGLLRREFGYPPLGDLRQCLVALSEDSEVTAALRSASEFRFDKNSSLNGHNLGNLLLAALTTVSNDLEDGINEMSRILRITGRVIPVSLEQADLCAELEDGTILREESNIDLRETGIPPISRVFLDPPVAANPRAVSAILAADLVVLGPGDLYTSIIPNLLVTDVAHALRLTSAKLVYVCNLMTKHGETDGYRASDFARTICHYMGAKLDWAVLNTGYVPPEVRKMYVDECAEPVVADEEEVGKHARRVLTAPLSE
ncbi:MAG: YvcK family protein, partial [Chloroflexi bacterium]|nr:YvcK family protein [Chloroflexota bacterium]